MHDTVMSLLPRGPIWNFIGDASRLFTGITAALQRVYDALRSAQAESMPHTADATLPEWCEAMAIAYNPTMPKEKTRRMLWAMFTAEQNCTPGGLAIQLAKEYAGLSIAEDSATGYSITGTVETATDALRVGAILARYAPLHLIPTVFGYTAATAGNPNPVPPSPVGGSILNVSGSAVCGIATSGLATCGVV
jgi:hypothetical protein